MAKRVQLIRHTTGNADSFTGLEGEVTVDITRKALRVHDGVVAGGAETAKADATNIQAASSTQDGKMTAAHVQQLDNAIPKVNPATAGNFALQNADGTLADSGIAKRYAEFPAGTKMVFAQAAAPTGWTQDVANDDAALRVVAASGGGVGGVHGLSSPPSTAHTHILSPHSHTVNNHTHSYTLQSHDHYLPIEVAGVYDSSGIQTVGCHVLLDDDLATNGTTFTDGESFFANIGQVGLGGAVFLNPTCTFKRVYSYTPRSLPTSNTTGAAPGTDAQTPTMDNGDLTPFQPKYVDVIIATKDSGLT